VLKISIIETKTQYRLVLEGKLIIPWTTEFRAAADNAARNLRGRELVIDVENLTAIGEDGTAALDELMRQGARFLHAGVFTRHVLRQLARTVPKKEMKG